MGQDAIAAVRRFSRFYTNLIGVLRAGLLDSTYSLTEARVVFELAQADSTEVADLRRGLDIDAGYLSRILGRLETDGLATRERSAGDGRRQVIRLTERGRRVHADLDARSDAQIGDLLAGVSAVDRRRLTAALASAEKILSKTKTKTPTKTPTGYVLRAPEAGDLGWVVQAHGALYAAEYGWDSSFEALVARIVADFADTADPKRSRAWIAEVDGERAGCVFCVPAEGASTSTARLRLLLVDPAARGTGIGGRLVDECLRFAKRAGYTEIVLWTNDVLGAARRIYERAGFELVRSDEHHSFGNDLVGQHWKRSL